MGLRTTVKDVLEQALVLGGTTGLLGRVPVGGVLVLAYHNIRPDGVPPAGDRSLHLPLADFQKQLDLLARRATVVPLAEALEPGGRSAPRVVITFDDAYHGALTLGLPALAARGLPATVFVTPGFLGGRDFWWDALATGDGMDEAVRHRALDDLMGKDVAIRAWAAANGLPVAAPAADSRGATEAALAAAAALPGMTLAAHTWEHSNLARLTEGELADELSRPLGWLRSRFPAVRPWLSYPYGRWSPAVAGAAAAAGYEAAFRVEGGWHRPGRDDRFAIPRLNVPSGLSPTGFELRLMGLLCR